LGRAHCIYIGSTDRTYQYAFPQTKHHLNLQRLSSLHPSHQWKRAGKTAMFIKPRRQERLLSTAHYIRPCHIFLVCCFQQGYVHSRDTSLQSSTDEDSRAFISTGRQMAQNCIPSVLQHLVLRDPIIAINYTYIVSPCLSTHSPLPFHSQQENTHYMPHKSSSSP
jgi:hypothetical protein